MAENGLSIRAAIVTGAGTPFAARWKRVADNSVNNENKDGSWSGGQMGAGHRLQCRDRRGHRHHSGCRRLHRRRAWARPANIGHVVCMVASPAAGYMTGANIRGDGGQVATVN